MSTNQFNSAESIPPSLGSLLRKLEFLSMISKGQKPCMHYWTFVDSNSWSASLYHLFGETKGNMMLHIQNIIEETVRGFNDYPLHQGILINTLFRAKRGIENLKYTYRDFPDTIASIIVLIQNIEMQENRYGSLLEVKSQPIKIPVRSVYPRSPESGLSYTEPTPRIRSTPDTTSERFERPPSSRIIPMLPSSKMGYSFRSGSGFSHEDKEIPIEHDDIVDDDGESKLDTMAPDPNDKEMMLVYPELDDIDNGTYVAKEE
jgi:hypothetical protein